MLDQTDLVQLDALEYHLPDRLKAIFLNLPLHTGILKDLKLLNGGFLPILDYTIAFKPELGLALQRLVESYNLLMLDQFTAYYKVETHKMAEIKTKLKLLEEKEAVVQKLEKQFKNKAEMIKKVIISKDQEIETLRDQLQMNQKQVQDLEQFLVKVKADMREDERALARKARLMEQMEDGFEKSDEEDNPHFFAEQHMKDRPIEYALDDYADAASHRQENLQNF